jgi:hypothetical protein
MLKEGLQYKLGRRSFSIPAMRVSRIASSGNDSRCPVFVIVSIHLLHFSRATTPQTLLRMLPTILTKSISKGRDSESISNGVSWFLNPLLSWLIPVILKCVSSEITRGKCVILSTKLLRDEVKIIGQPIFRNLLYHSSHALQLFGVP